MWYLARCESVCVIIVRVRAKVNDSYLQCEDESERFKLNIMRSLLVDLDDLKMALPCYEVFIASTTLRAQKEIIADQEKTKKKE